MKNKENNRNIINFLLLITKKITAKFKCETVEK
jgi:hypothetical protein